MANCHLCGGVITEPGKIYPYHVNACRCSQVLIQEDADRQRKIKWLDAMEERRGSEYKETIKAIVTLSSNLTEEQLLGVIEVLKALHDSMSLAAKPGGFKKREANE